MECEQAPHRLRRRGTSNKLCCLTRVLSTYLIAAYSRQQVTQMGRHMVESSTKECGFVRLVNPAKKSAAGRMAARARWPSEALDDIMVSNRVVNAPANLRIRCPASGRHSIGSADRFGRRYLAHILLLKLPIDSEGDQISTPSTVGKLPAALVGAWRMSRPRCGVLGAPDRSARPVILSPPQQLSDKVIERSESS